VTGATGRRRAVAVDVTPLLTVRTGIGRSVAEVLGALARLADPPVVLPYALGARSRRYRPHAPAGTRFVPLPTRVLLAAWGRGEVPRLDRWLHGAGVVHATNFVVPASRLPTVVTVHDCSFELFPETVNPVVARFGAILRRALARGATVHVTSEQVAREVENLFGPGLEAAGRLAVIPFGVPAIDVRYTPVASTVAASTDTFGRSRAIIVTRGPAAWLCHPVRSVGVNAPSGIHASIGSTRSPLKPRGATPTIVNISPASRTSRPMTSPLSKRRAHNS